MAVTIDTSRFMDLTSICISSGLTALCANGAYTKWVLVYEAQTLPNECHICNRYVSDIDIDTYL